MPRSNCAGVAWPPLPDDHGAQMLALQYQFGQSQWWPVKRLQDLQLQQFAQVFRHAVTTVPYYRERFAPWTAGITSWEQYRALPVSARRDIQQAGVDMHSIAPLPGHGALVTTQSSGSTGSPLVTRGTAWTQLLWHALLLRDHFWHGRDLNGKLAAIRSTTGERRSPNWGAGHCSICYG